jgi:hypothetical protein
LAEFSRVINRAGGADGSLQISSDDCAYTFRPLRAGTMLLMISGRDTGQLGRAPLGEVAAEAALQPPLHLLIDMSLLTHVSAAVSADWTAWFQTNRQALRRVDVLAPDPFVRLVVAVSQKFSGTERVISIHTDAARFAALVDDAASAASRP